MDKQEEQTWQERLMARLKTNYRLVVMNEDTFEEVDTYHSNMLRLLTLICAALLTVSFLTALFFLFSPLKTMFSNFGSGVDKKTLQLESKIEDLEGEIAAHQLWQDNIRKVLIGEADTLGTGGIGTNESAMESKVDSGLTEVPRIPLDEELRQNIASGQETPNLVTNVNLPISDVPLGQRFFSPPLTGEISKVFEPLEKHYGIDIIAPKNTAIKSTLDGYVVSADWNLETGNTICIQHKGDVITFYKHNSALLKKVGDNVKAGEAIAIIGDTGDHSSGPHLHFELWHKGIPVDPGDYVNFY